MDELTERISLFMANRHPDEYLNSAYYHATCRTAARLMAAMLAAFADQEAAEAAAHDQNTERAMTSMKFPMLGERFVVGDEDGRIVKSNVGPLS